MFRQVLVEVDERNAVRSTFGAGPLSHDITHHDIFPVSTPVIPQVIEQRHLGKLREYIFFVDN
jgi:hypothetical protein